MQNPIFKLKQEQKERAKKLKELKKTRPLKNRGNKELWEIEMEVCKLSYDFRHNHIVYCEFNGRRRKEIENNVRENNKANENLVDKIKENLLNNLTKWHEQKVIYYNAA